MISQSYDLQAIMTSWLTGRFRKPELFPGEAGDVSAWEHACWRYALALRLYTLVASSELASSRVLLCPFLTIHTLPPGTAVPHCHPAHLP